MIKHYQCVHGTEAGFRIVCGINNCYSSYNNVMYLCRHMRQKHADFYAKNMMCVDVTEELEKDAEENNDITDSSVESVPLVSSVSSADVLPKNKEVAHLNESLAVNHIASFSLKLREFDKVSGSACEDLRNNIGSMLCMTREMLLDKIGTQLSGLPVDPRVMNVVRNAMLNQTPFEMVCDTLAHERNVNKHVETSFPFVEPVQYVLGNAGTNQEDCMQYISILSTLKVLLQNDEVFSAVVNNHSSSDGKLRDLCDGSHFNEHPLFSNGSDKKPVLQIVLYYDDFCGVNPLGHRAKQYKVVGFYFMLANIEPKHRSRLHTINLTAVCFSGAVKKYGFSNILDPLVNELIILGDQGVTVTRPEGEFTFKGSLLVVVADNLAAHSIGGYFESFKSTHPCRFCLVSRDKMRSTLKCDPVSLRTEHSHDMHVKRVVQDKVFQSVYGLKTNSCLNSAPYFHVTSGLPSDIMHDLLEGVVCDVIECVIQHYVSCGTITLDYLNEVIENFPYKGVDKVNKPNAVQVTTTFKFRQTAAKNRCFLRLLPAMIGHKIEAGDSKWEVLLHLLDVHDAAFSPVMSYSDTVILDDLVHAFLESFSCEFPDESFKPKMHFLTHYGSHCRKYGPLVNYWSFRFEGKHGYFKERTSRMKNRKNVLKTLAKKHQYRQSWHLHNSSYLWREHMVSSGGRQVPVCTLSSKIEKAIKPFCQDAILYQVESVEVDGIFYSCDMAVVTAVHDSELQFSKICTIFIINSCPYFVVCELNEQIYWRHFHLFCCKATTSFFARRATDFVDPFPHTTVESVDDKLCIILKHGVNCD